MNKTSPSPIPIPLGERWRDARHRGGPALVFLASVVLVALLWREHVAAPTMVGQAEPVVSNVASHKAGVLTGLTVARFQRVKAGDVIGQVTVANPQYLEASLGVIRAETDMLRASLDPIVDRQRNAVNHNQLRLDWMKSRAALATAKVNVQLTEAEWRLTEKLYNERVVSELVRDQSKAAYMRAQSEVEELGKLVAEGERVFPSMQPTNVADITQVSDEPMRAAIALQEAKLHQVEAELAPVELKAPMDGIVSTIFCQPGASVTVGQPLVAITTLSPVRIVGYLRPPITDEPKPGMKVEVRTRGLRRQFGEATVVEVGTQLEALPLPMVGPIKLASVELGLPVDITLPPNLKIRPGELVDITLRQ